MRPLGYLDFKPSANTFNAPQNVDLSVLDELPKGTPNKKSFTPPNTVTRLASDGRLV